jgi:RNA polymerase sigma-70 factor (ECF subfamily)
VEWLYAHLRAVGLATLRKRHATSLYLTFGCARGDQASLRAFDTVFLSRVGRYVAGLNDARWFADDVRQELRQRLFLMTNEGPRIGTYLAHGPLSAWVRAAAIRTAQNLLRATGEAPVTMGPEPATETDPETEYARLVDTEEVRSALRTALAATSETDREILRLYYVEEQNIGDIGVRLDLHRATVARRLVRLHEVLNADVGAALRSRLGLEDRELHALVEGVVDLQLGAMLTPEATGSPRSEEENA